MTLPLAASAHNLIPQNLVDYVQSHPNATPTDIEAFANAQDPEFASQYQNGAQILEMARNQDTNLTDTLVDFFKLGVNHILSGQDHILFVLSLLLVFASLREILKLVTSFTVAHSITLGLAASGILIVSPRVSEPLIALSIAYVAITSVFFSGEHIYIRKALAPFHLPQRIRSPLQKLNRYLPESKVPGKPASVFFFGLFHGMGFAGLLREIQIPSDKFLPSLFSFNLGIELGQLIIIAIALPVIYLCRNKPWYPLAVRIVAAIIAAIALVWFIQRIFWPV